MWKLRWSASALKDMREIDKKVAKIIALKVEGELNGSENPLEKLSSLKYAKKGQYKYRVGQYRIICILVDAEIVVEVIQVGHRRNIYK